MKTIDEYIENFWGTVNKYLVDDQGRFVSLYDIKLVMNTIQRDSYNEAINDATKICESSLILNEHGIGSGEFISESILKLKK